MSERDTIISCRNSQGTEIHATPVTLNRHTVVFEVYNPFSILQLSEVLHEFRISIGDRVLYAGRAVVSNIVNAGIMLVCEAALEEAWLDVDLFAPLTQPDRLRVELLAFLEQWEKIHSVGPDFKVVVADMQNLLVDLRRWLEQVELGIRSIPSGNRLRIEREVIGELGPLLPAMDGLFSRFEVIAQAIEPALHPMHRTYMRRQLHPLVLCSPFAYRTFQKPLGYAGDYQMVNMILNDPLEGASMFAKTVNLWFWNQIPAVAHRNRVQYLHEQLVAETARAAAEDRRLRVFNLGCGPAGEIQQFLAANSSSSEVDFTLADFNDETLEYAKRRLEQIRSQHNRTTHLEFVKRSVHQMLKDAARDNPAAPKYDLVYCAGLFDYLSDRICQRLMNIFYDMVAPGGLLIATNVDASNPTRNGMEFLLEWHLIYRNQDQLKLLHPLEAPRGSVATKSDATGVNIYLEVRKPGKS
jgi:extracellular factor (EF) 3-hydroxypalmitic acid methyl ester biosynthesis protein